MATTSNDLELITPTSTDGPAILEIAKGINLFDAGDVETILELWTDFLSHGDQESWYHFLAAKLKSDLVGYACYGKRPLTQGTFDLYWIAVKSKHQREGIGEFLLKHVEARVKESGGHLLIAETAGKPAYEPTRHFYFARGYQLEGRVHDFYAIGDDLYIFTKHFPV
ncbi:MAG: GNAT family N-acetyltransferase [Chloroflexota bacterium]